MLYRDKRKLSGVFVRFRAPLQTSVSRLQINILLSGTTTLFVSPPLVMVQTSSLSAYSASAPASFYKISQSPLEGEQWQSKLLSVLLPFPLQPQFHSQGKQSRSSQFLSIYTRKFSLSLSLSI
jgi:hypothetical protein